VRSAGKNARREGVKIRSGISITIIAQAQKKTHCRPGRTIS